MLSWVRSLSTDHRRLIGASLLILSGMFSLSAVFGTPAAAQTSDASPAANHSAQAESAGRPDGPAADPLPKARVELNSEVAWEYRPYKVAVWLVDDGSQIFRRIDGRIIKRIQRDAQLEEFNGWDVRCVRPSVVWNSRLGCDWGTELSDFTKPLCDDASLRDADKLIVIRLGQSAGGFDVQSRELDLATKQWSGLTHFPVAEIDLIPARAFAAMRKSFMPLTRIERVANETVYVRTRASALSRRLEADNAGNLSEVANQDSPLWVRDTDVLLPVLRRDSHENRTSNAEPVAWTFLSIEERLGSTLKCLTHTAQLAPLAGRSGSTIKKLGLVVRPDPKPTTLYITAQDSKTATPISGLEVYYCRPENLKAKDYQLLGRTDWKGAISVAPAEDGSIRYIIVKNGKLAFKKPVLPGLTPTLTAPVPSDRARVFAEGVIYGLRGEIIELAALRATTRMRIEIALEKEQFEKADKILNQEYLKIRSLRQLGIRMTEIKERLMNRKDADVRQRSRIESMFDGLEQAIGETLQRNDKEKDKDPDATDLIRRVVNKISGKGVEGPVGDILTDGQEEVLPPNKPQPVPPTSAESQQFD